MTFDRFLELDRFPAWVRARTPAYAVSGFATILERQFECDQEGAEELLSAIADVWEEKSYSLPEGSDWERPDPGLLKAIGYRVGWQRVGFKPTVRLLYNGFRDRYMALR